MEFVRSVPKNCILKILKMISGTENPSLPRHHQSRVVSAWILV